MKKIFTLISVALIGLSANAQTESYTANIEDFSTTEVTLNKTANVTVVAVGGNVLTCENAENSNEVTKTPATWEAKNQGDINFDWVVVKDAVPYVAYGTEQVERGADGVLIWRPTYEYYEPDGSKGLPVNGEYVKLTVKTAGMFKIGFWVNKNAGRKLYLVRESDKKALQWDADPDKTEYKVEGYANGFDEPYTKEDGTTANRKQFIPSFPVDDYELAGQLTNTKVKNDDGTDKVVNIAGQPKFAWFVFDAVEGETYWVFGSNWQLGFNGYKFTPGATQHDYDPTTGIQTVQAQPAAADAPVYNLAGQRVAPTTKGLLIKNGKKFVNR